MTNRVTHSNYLKLRSGQTVWRCYIDRDGNVCISEVLLAGKKVLVPFRSIYDNRVINTMTVIRLKGDKYGGNYLGDVRGYHDNPAFTSRRAALRWKQEVEAGLHPAAVLASMDHYAFVDSMVEVDDYYDSDGHDTRDEYALEVSA